MAVFGVVWSLKVQMCFADAMVCYLANFLLPMMLYGGGYDVAMRGFMFG